MNKRSIDSVAVMICPKCGARRYVTQEGLHAIEAAETMAQIMAKETGTTAGGVVLRHDTCGTQMALFTFAEELPPPVTIADLSAIHVFGKTVRDISDVEFRTWMKSFGLTIPEEQTYTLEERANVCDVLMQHGLLPIRKKAAER